MAKRRKLHEISIEDDIRYRGPLSYVGFQILGWLCITLTAVILLFRIGGKISPQIAQQTAGTINVLTYINSLSLPFLLIANFSKILNNSEGYKKQLIKNGGVAAAIFLAVILLASRYFIGTVSLFVSDPENVVPSLTDGFRAMVQNGFIAFNLFVDMFLCTLFMFFLNAQPKKIFTGKKRIVFRLFAILPVAYEICSMILKGRAAAGEITLPLWTFPLLTVKPPMTFVLFMVLAIFVKTREIRFRRHGRTHAEYQAFLKTNRNSLHFSAFLSAAAAIAAIIDFFVLTVLTAKAAPSAEALQDTGKLLKYMSVGMAMGFGESIPLLFVVPFVMLYSYTRIPKNKMISILIPVIAIVLMILILLEGGYQGAGIYAGTIEKIPLRQIIEMIRMDMAAV